MVWLILFYSVTDLLHIGDNRVSVEFKETEVLQRKWDLANGRERELLVAGDGVRSTTTTSMTVGYPCFGNSVQTVYSVMFDVIFVLHKFLEMLLGTLCISELLCMM